MIYLGVAVIGLVSGLASGLFGVGGGIVMVPALLLGLNLPIKTVIGTSLAVIIPTAMIGTFKHQMQAQVNWGIALALAPTAILGGYWGAWLTTQISGDNLKRGFGGLLILAGLRLLFFK